MSINPHNAVPRDPKREADDSIRGFLRQFIRVIEVVFDRGERGLIFVEAFEDVLSSIESILKAEQVKDRAGTISISTQKSFDMFESWTSQLVNYPNLEFAYVSTQEAGNMHDKETAFVEWVNGEHTDAVAERIRISLAKFMSGIDKSKYINLAQIIDDSKNFRSFWYSIEWILEGPTYEEAFSAVKKRVSTRYKSSDNDARNRLLMWLAAIADSATKGSIEEKTWTLDRLDTLDPTEQVISIAAILRRLLEAPVPGTDPAILADRDTFNRLRAVLPSDGSIEFIRDQNFDGFSFSLDAHKDVWNFIPWAKLPDNSFLDSALEVARQHLFETAKEFSHRVGIAVEPKGNDRVVISEEWERRNPESYRIAVDGVHEIQDVLLSAYDSMILLGKKTLLV